MRTTEKSSSVHIVMCFKLFFKIKLNKTDRGLQKELVDLYTFICLYWQIYGKKKTSLLSL